jgi:hypothetical protein
MPGEEQTEEFPLPIVDREDRGESVHQAGLRPTGPLSSVRCATLATS